MRRGQASDRMNEACVRGNQPHRAQERDDLAPACTAMRNGNDTMRSRPGRFRPRWRDDKSIPQKSATGQRFESTAIGALNLVPQGRSVPFLAQALETELRT